MAWLVGVYDKIDSFLTEKHVTHSKVQDTVVKSSRQTDTRELNILSLHLE